MQACRYYLALALVITLPPLLLFWLLIHPFVGFWRRVGPKRTYSLILLLLALGTVGLYLVRRTLLAVEFGTNYLLTLIGVLLLAGAVRLGFWLHRYLSVRTLLGLPELAPEKQPGKLVTEGPYALIRHPRYVELYLAFLGYALIANYLALYVAVALWLPGIYVIVVLEEKELRNRFGEAYEDYCRRVPRFIPRFGRG